MWRFSAVMAKIFTDNFLELIRALRKLSVKILAMTAEKRHMNAARDFGAEHVFDKPLEAESVIEYVKTTIEAA